VLPLITPHFIDRYADQIWVIYNTRRGYGMHYDGRTVQEVRFAFVPDTAKLNAPELQTPHEDLYQRLWQAYFKSVNIPARRNPYPPAGVVLFLPSGLAPCGQLPDLPPFPTT